MSQTTLLTSWHERLGSASEDAAARRPPRSIQYRCVLTVKLQGIEVGHTDRVSFVGESHAVRAE